jgi:RHS repeat-associated protein
MGTAIFVALAAILIGRPALAGYSEYKPELFPVEFQPSFFNTEIIPVSSPNTGGAAYRFPLLTPPGRGKAAPSLAITYSSHQSNGWLGVGWDLNPGYVQRATKKGLDYKGAEFIRVQDALTELVPRPGWGAGHFGAKVEERFDRFRYLSDSLGWTVTSREGVRSHYGSSADSRQAGSRGVFRWYLDRVVDTNGNTMTFEYARFGGGQLYLREIRYSCNRILFDLTERSDAYPGFRSFEEVTEDRLLSTIRVYGNGELARTYAFGYESGPLTGRSRLKSVRMNAYPPAVFTWQEGGSGAVKPAVTTQAPSGSRDVGYVHLSDVTGDGRADLVTRTMTGLFYVHAANPDGSFDPPATHSLPYGANDTGFVHFADINGDGRSDIVKRNLYGHVYTYLARADGGFSSAQETLTAQGANDGGMVSLADVTGDGRADLVKRTMQGHVHVYPGKTDGKFAAPVATYAPEGEEGAGYAQLVDVNGDNCADLVKTSLSGRIYVYLSDRRGGFGFAGDKDCGQGEEGPGYLLFGDLNGDGLTDLVKHDPYGRFFAYLSRGDGTFTSFHETKADAGKEDPGYVFLADLNGDGLADLLKREVSDGRVYIYYSEGDGFFNPNAEAFTCDHGDNNPGVFDLADVDGDRTADIVKRTTDGRFHVYRLDVGAPDLLARVNNGQGATTNLSYAYSNDFPDSQLPFVVSTVSAIAVNDGNGVESRFAFAYEGGRYDAEDQEFRGFGRALQVNPDQTVLERLFHQDDYRKGRDYLTQVRTPNGGGNDLLRRTEVSWDLEEMREGCFVRPVSKKHYFYYGPTAWVEERFAFGSAHGYPLQQRQSGSDGETVVTSYQYADCGNWTWRRTAERIEGESSGTARLTTYDYYPGTGNLRLEDRYTGGGGYSRRSFAYDGYGNPVSETDPNGNTTAYAYEEVAHAYPRRTERPVTEGIAHVEENLSFDYRTGKPTRSRDENGQVTSSSYDDRGRTIRVDLPDGGRTETIYNDAAVPRFAETRVFDGSGTPIRKIEFFDGLSRLIRTRTYGEGQKPILVTRSYDAMGRSVLERGPCFADGNGNCAGEHPWEERQYDLFGRVVRFTRPDGRYGTTRAAMAYSGLAMTVTDPDEARQTMHFDHLGRVTRVVEHADGGDVATDYDHNAAGDLLRVTRPGNLVLEYEYDWRGLTTRMHDPDMGTWSYAYDGNGNKVSQTDAKGQTISWTYDALNRVKTRTYSTGQAAVQYRYDDPSVPNGRGRLSSAATASVALYRRAYDSMGRTLEEERRIAGYPGAFTTHYGFDPAGRPSAMVYPGDGYEVRYRYYPGTELLGEVTGTAEGQPGEELLAEFESYRPDGKIGYMALGNGTATTYAYDPLSTRLTGIRTQDAHTGPETDLLRKRYVYTPAGDVLEIHNELSRQSLYYRYDRMHRLTGESDQAGSPPPGPGAVEILFEYGGSKPQAASAVTLNGGRHATAVDDNGNITRVPDLTDPAAPGVRLVSYNADNMPARITNSGGGRSGETDLIYDPENARAKKSASNGSTVYYAGPHFELRNGVPVKHIFAGSLRLAKMVGPTVYYFHKDHLQSTNVLSTDSGTRTEQAETLEYLPYGLERHHGGSRVASYTFTDQEWDAETGLYNYDARMYDPATAGFISPDALLQDIYAPALLNRYIYVGNNPLGYIDPTGHFRSSDWLRSFVPGQVHFDYGLTSLENKQYAMAALHFSAMAGEQVLFALSFRTIPTIESSGISNNTLGTSVNENLAKTTAIQKYFPDNNGFLAETERKFLMKGDKIDRFGGNDYSRFFSPEGTPPPARSLPPETAQQTLRTYEVLKPFEVESGTVAPWFGQTGLGTQYRTPVQLKTLLDRGVIREITP